MALKGTAVIACVLLLSGGASAVDFAPPKASEFESQIKGPDVVIPGHEFEVTYSLTNLGQAAKLVRVDSKFSGADACSLIGTMTSNIDPINENTYLLLGRSQEYAQRIAEELDLGETLEPSSVIPTHTLRLGFHVQTLSNKHGAQCNVRVDAEDISNPLQSIDPLSKIIELDKFLNTIYFGHMTGRGGLVADDRMNYENPAGLVLDTVRDRTEIFSLSQNPTITYMGFMSFDDGKGNGSDYGKYYFTDPQTGRRVEEALTVAGSSTTSDLLLNLAKEEVTLKKGETKFLNRCYWGQYIDGGWWDKVDDVAKKCRWFKVSHIDDPSTGVAALEASLPSLLQEIRAGGPIPANVSTLGALLEWTGPVLVPYDEGASLRIEADDLYNAGFGGASLTEHS